VPGAPFCTRGVTSSTLNGALAEGINGVRTVQGMGRETVNLRLFEEKVPDNLDAQLRCTWLAQIMVPIVDTLTGASMGIVVVAGGVAVLERASSPSARWSPSCSTSSAFSTRSVH
jgi:ATP-binding cassette subfamily B multidrug efflux pump